MTVNAIAVKNAAYEHVVGRKLEPLPADDYTLEDFNRYDKAVSAIAKSVPSNHDGGKHGYVGLVKGKEAYAKLVADENAVFKEQAMPADAPQLEKDDTPAQVALKTAEHEAELERFYTQAGCKEGLRDIIVGGAPEAALMALEDDENGLSNVDPVDLMEQLRSYARVTDCIDVGELLEQRNEPINFDGEVTLETHFTKLVRQMKALKTHHDIVTSESELMVTLLRQIKTQGDFKDEVTEWETKTTGADWAAFQVHFAKADDARRQRNKYANRPARDTEFNSANAAIDTDGLAALIRSQVSAEVGAGMAEVTKATQETINAAIGKDSGEGTAALEKKLESLRKENAALKAAASKQGGSRSFQCEHCDRKHPAWWEPEKCYAHPKSRKNAPQWFKEKHPGIKWE